MSLPTPLDGCLQEAERLVEVAETAARNRKALSGHGRYADRFHDAVISLSVAENALMAFLRTRAAGHLEKIRLILASIKAPATEIDVRKTALKQLELLFRVELVPALISLDEPRVPDSEPVLPSSLFKNAPQYLLRINLQANGCFNERWFDACGVMIRRIVESLIIEVYERNGRPAEVKSGDHYLMLADLVGKITSQTHWALNREAQKTLPHLKTLGDRSAHTRYYGTQRNDIEKVLPGLRVTTENLLQHARYEP